MRLTPRIFPCVLLAAVVAVTPLAGCRRTPVVTRSTIYVYDDASYRQWEQETHREHRDPAQRTDDEKRQYNDWRRDHERH